MEARVIPYAKENGALWFVPSEGLSYEEALNENTKFIIEKMDQGYTIIDIGPQPGGLITHFRHQTLSDGGYSCLW